MTDATLVFTVVFSLFLLSGCLSERKFDGYTVLRMLPDTEAKVNFLKSVADNFDSDLTYINKVDFWRRPKGVNQTVDIMLAPDVKDDMTRLLATNEIQARIMVKDVETLVRNERNRSQLYTPIGEEEEIPGLLYQNRNRQQNRRRSWLRQPNSFFQDYHRLSEVFDYMNELATAYPNRVKLRSLGKSHEGRELLMWIIGNENPTRKQKDIIWVDSGIHAREWISPATGLFMATELVTKADSISAIGNLLDVFDFHMLPVSNPDGYEHTHVNDRMWRKTRSRSGRGWDVICRGTDPNRNWGFHWNEAGSSSHPCSDIYAGPSAFSEPETKAMSDYILKNKDRIAAYITLHSYSQLILTPWGWTKDLPEAYPDMERVALSAARALKSIYGTEYTVGSSTRVLYEASGGSDDWAHGAAGIKYSYTIELRDTGDHGFVLPKEHIIPTGEETTLLLVDMAQNFAKERGLFSRKKPIPTTEKPF